MATHAQIANDLSAQAALLYGTGNDQLAKSMRRGAQAIRDLMQQKAELEAAAEAAELKYLEYVQGDGACATR